jgi:hypothetical protein
MKRTLGLCFCALGLCLFGCEVTTTSDGGTDTGTADTGTTDTSTGDTGGGDTGGDTSMMMGCKPATGMETRIGGTTAGGRFDPTSAEVAIVTFEGFSATGLEVLDLCGDTVAEIATGDTPRSYIAWSPDGSTLYYVNSDGLSMVPAAGGTPEAVVADADTFDLSPDGTTIVYSDSGDLFTWDIAGGMSTDLMQTGTFPRYDADGTQIAFADDSMLKIMTVSDGMVTDVTALDSAAFQPLDWFSDGSLVIVSSEGLQRVTPDPGGAMVEMIAAVTAAQDVDVSPDDSLLAYRINGMLPTIILGL